MTLLAPEEERVETADVDAVEPAADAVDSVAAEDQTKGPNAVLTAASAALSVAAAALLAGGMFRGGTATLLALFAVALSSSWVAMSFRLRRPAIMQWAVIPLLVVVGAAAAAMDASGGRNPFDLANDALQAGGIANPPIPFDPGWRVLLVLLMGGLASGVTMVALSYGIPKLAVFGPVPVTFGALLLQPPTSGSLRTAAALSVVVIALVLSFGVDLDREGAVSAAFQLRRILRGMGMLVVLLSALAGLTRVEFLFPPPKQDQVVPPQKPRLPPPEPDRVLFTVASDALLPWRLGTLDVYDGRDFLTPPFSQARLLPIAPDGSLPPGIGPPTAAKTVRATFNLQDVRDRVLPVLPGAQRVTRAEGFDLNIDPRTQMVRLPDKLPRRGQGYTVEAAAPAGAAELKEAPPAPRAMDEFTEVPPAPVGVQSVLDEAPVANAYERLQFVRAAYYRGVVAAGAGEPVSVPPHRVEAILGGDPASPFEITAGEVLMARWAGLPARFGYGYYGGDEASEVREVRPKHGATWLEVYFEGHGWVAFVGTPPKAQGSLGATNPNPAVLPSQDLALTVLVPVQQAEIRLFYSLARYWLARTVPWVAGGVLALWGYPWLFKTFRRVRRTRWAARRGPRERIAVAYAELRDLAADLNLGAPVATPLEFRSHVEPDEEHAELAWLVTRAIWGDLSRDCRDADAVRAEEAAASLRKRLAGAQPSFNRVLAAASRTSLRSPYSTEMPNLWWPPRWRSHMRPRFPAWRRVALQPQTAAVVAVALLLGGCAREVPLRSAAPAVLPTIVVPPTIDAYRFVREPKAEESYTQVRGRALVAPGQVFTLHDGPNVQASVQVAPFKQSLLAAGRQTELRDEVLRSLGAGRLELRRAGRVTYRMQSLPDRRIFLYMPPDTNYMMLLIARISFQDAERVFRHLIALQRGEDPASTGRVAELPDPLRGIPT